MLALYLIALLMIAILIIVSIPFIKEVITNTIEDITDILFKVVAILIVISELGITIVIIITIVKVF